MRVWSGSGAVRLWLGCVAVVAVAGSALASSDYIVANPVWRLAAPAFDDVSRPAIAPGNDTRVNLIWLMRSVHPVGDAGATYARPVYENEALGHSFLTWASLRQTYWPHPERDDSAPVPDACTPPAGAVAAFSQALDEDKAVPASERAALVALRAKVGCGAVEWAAPVATAQGREYLAYLKAAAAFYAGDWQAAEAGFAALDGAHSAWIAETAAYMPVRIALSAATAKAVDSYGDYDPGGVDRGRVGSARDAIARYLKAYPHGRYAASATGLIRRTLWLSGDTAALVPAYELLIAETPPDSERAADLAQEIDSVVLSNKAEATLVRAGHTPLLLAISDLRQMRLQTGDEGPARPMTLSDGDLAAQAPVFAAHGDLYGFLQATRGYYAGADPAQTIAAMPEDLRAPGATPLAFSRQVLRGMALARANDPAQAQFWPRLIAGARPLLQRPFAEVGLAVHWQQAGRLDLIFAPGSPIEDQTTREILMQTIAPPAILRAEAADRDRPAHERDIARFTLLYKDLTRQAYADFGRDVALVPADANNGTIYDLAGENPVATGLFARGKWSDGYACPALALTAATLARDPQDRNARLCLGDFWRLNGFDTFALIDTDHGADTLGHRPDRFPGIALRRDAIYTQIAADPRANAAEKAYALYRAVMCYAPAGYNACANAAPDAAAANAASVPQTQRKAWFLELKQRYPDSRWAKALRYYW